MKPKLIEHGNAEPSLAVMSGRCREQVRGHHGIMVVGNAPTSAPHPAMGDDMFRHSEEIRRGKIKSLPLTVDHGIQAEVELVTFMAKFLAA